MAKKKTSILEEFKKFALKGNMIDLAVGIIIGGAFSALVNSIVNDIIMPIVGWITGGIDFSNKFIQLSGTHQPTLAAAKATGATIAYGHFITLAINFLIIAWILFLAVKGINAARALGEAEEKANPEVSSQDKILMEIRDLIKNETLASSGASAASQIDIDTTKK